LGARQWVAWCGCWFRSLRRGYLRPKDAGCYAFRDVQSFEESGPDAVGFQRRRTA
jgi:hypothetical protein